MTKKWKDDFLDSRKYAQIMRMMKFYVLFMLFAMLHTYGNVHSQNLTLSVENASLKEVFREIEKNSDYRFLFKSDDVVGRVKTYEAIIKGENIPEPGIPESFKVLIKELQSLGLDVKVLKEDQTEVELMETVDYGDTDLRSVIEGDNKDYNRKEESSFGEYGYTKQEFEGDELVDVQEESAPDEAIFSPDEVFEEE